MKKITVVFITLIFVFVGIMVAFSGTYDSYQTKIFTKQGGDSLFVKSSGQISILSGGYLDFLSGAHFNIAGTRVTSSAAELNYIDGSTAGTSVASKALVLGTTKNTDSLRVNYVEITGSSAKGIDFANKTPNFSDADNAWISMGTWNDGIDIRGQTEHFVPLQIHLDTWSNVAKDIAAARFRVDTDSTVTDAAIGCLQLRQNLAHNLASSAILNASVNVSDAVTVGTGSLLGGYFSIEGSGAITKAGSNDCTPLVAVNNNTGATTVDNVIVAMQNGTGTTIGEIVNVIAEHGTATVGVNIVEGTSGVITNDIGLQNGETIDNTLNGTVKTTGNIAATGFITGLKPIHNITAAADTFYSTTTPYAAALANCISGVTFVAQPIAQKSTLFLQSAVAGAEFDVIVGDADTLRIVAASGDSIYVAGTADRSVSTVVGTAKIKATDGIRWFVTSYTGTWTLDHGVQ